MKLTDCHGISYPAKMKFGSWIVAGPPGSGKSWLIDRIGGYPGEVGIDISQDKWWTVEPLTHRPRELHFAFPFKGLKDALSVYDEPWRGRSEFPELDFDRIRIPKKKKFVLAPNWRARFVFDFILPPPTWLFENRKRRLSSGDVRLVDMGLTQEWIAWQVHIHWQVAWFFHQSGLQVMLRPFNTARPYSFPVLRKVLKKKAQAAEKAVNPEMDWSKVKFVKLWFDEASPDKWKFQPLSEKAA
ncbi:MAG: serine/threonine protein phosphatase [Pseudomonadota bacterium]|nr:serine/threonine protein phosphatase [Pseudomonadota bacterium]